MDWLKKGLSTTVCLLPGGRRQEKSRKRKQTEAVAFSQQNSKHR